MPEYRSSKQVAEDLNKYIAEAEQLQAKSRTEQLTADEDARLEECLASAEAAEAEHKRSIREERLTAQKDRANAPVHEAPHFTPAQYRTNDTVSVGEGMGLWIGANQDGGDRSARAHYRAAKAGFDLNRNRVRIPVSYDGLNLKTRAYLSKGGSGTGADYVYKTYSDKVVEYMSLASPLVSLLGSETTADGNERVYFKVDDTGMKSAYTTASSGTETAPNIRQTNFATASVSIKTFDAESGRQIATFNILRDSAVSIEDKIAKANAHSHARFIEEQVIVASGNGSSGVQGLQSAATALSDVASWSVEALEGLYYSVPAQYRANAIFLCNTDTAEAIHTVLKDDVGRSLFDKNLTQGLEFEVLMGKKFVVSDYVDDDTVLFFNPDHYMLRLVDGQIFQQFTETYWPNVAWAGVMSFGGAWVGPSSSCKKLSLS